MNDLDNMYLFIAIVLFIILLYKINNGFGRTKRELEEMREKIDALLEVQKKDSSERVINEEPAEKYMPRTAIAEAEKEEELFVSYLMEEEVLDEDIPIEEVPELVVDKIAPIVPVEVEVAPKEVPVVAKKKSINYEKFIGENLFGKIGILVFVIGVGLFVKYAIDQDWINETMRTVLGFLTGSALLAVAERLQKKYRTFSSLLAGGAFAVFYLTVAIAYHYYHLFSQTAAFVILVGITVVMSALSLLYDRRELAVISLIGGFLAPFLVSSGEGDYVVLFTYLTVLNLGMFGLSFYKKWGELLVISFAFTYLVMGSYVLTSYGNKVDATIVACHLFVFATLFYFIFVLPVLSILKVGGRIMGQVLLSIVVSNSFLYLMFGSLFLHDMMLPFEAEGLLCLFIAIVNMGLVIWLKKSKGDFQFLVYALLGLVLTFVSVAVPIQLDGNYITLFWASEMVLLLWLFLKSKVWVYEVAAMVLTLLTTISFLIDILVDKTPETMFLNSAFATSLFVGLAMGAFALLMECNKSFFSTARLLNYRPWNAIMTLGSVAVLYYTFFAEFCFYYEGTIRSGALLLLTSASIFAACYGLRNRFPIARHTCSYLLAMGCSVLIYMLIIWFNLGEGLTSSSFLLRWLAVAFVIATLVDISRRYYRVVRCTTQFTVYLNILSTLVLLTMDRLFLWQVGIDDFSAGMSLTLCAVGLTQMSLGMRLHQKVLRIVSLVTFGLVLAKLGLVDIWAMPTIGKIIVFIILGLILLILSFLYQKLKDVLFRNDEDEEEE